ncbi:G-type lectin S-receptor-like serine/threonine-protein kinase [Camellia lanceoleosa]|uniref:G-type lectin S-receptor-like serine/threonine-protein kinase n=1 Tax=Camellia lanceoleosa TaxID=1840588 RepID=A0ACC0HDA0_9ERIC|nr:G-type lectin S-receptor-like serine/threonine-protein kinase [Camellia lanceoleosa]
MYYQMAPNQSSIDQISLTATGHCRLLRNNQVNSSSRNSDGSNYADLQTGGFLVNLGTTSSQAQQQQQPLDSVIEYVRLNSDGSLKLYRYDNNSRRSSEIVDMVSQDLGACQYPRLCGDYGLCKAGKCSCPPGDDGIQYFQSGGGGGGGGGCSRITPLSCKQQDQLIEVINGTYFNVIDPTAAFPNITNMEECKQACRRNCSCGAAFFRYDNNTSDGYCYMPSEVLSIRQDEIPNHSFKSATYIKVEKPSKVAPNPVPEGRPAAPPSLRNRKRLIAIKKAEEDQLLEIVETLDDDEEVRDHREEMVRLIRIAAWCLQNDHTRRPLMSTVVKVLEGVMEVDPNINYKFTHAMGSSSVADHLVSSAPQASVLSNPR